MNNYNDLLYQLNIFIDKYYKNRLKKGFILYLIFFSILILVVSILEYFGWFSSNLRFFIFSSTVTFSIVLFAFFILLPAFRFFGIAPKITYKHAANLIRQTFPEIQDKLINILELKEIVNENISHELLVESINQKIKAIKKFDFSLSLNKEELYKLIKYGLLLLIINILVAIFNPEIFTKGTVRIINYNKVYQRDLGFSIWIDTSKLIVEKGKNLSVDIKLEGENIPEELFIYYGGNSYLLNKENLYHYYYLFKHVNSNFSFSIRNSYFSSHYFNVKTFNSPVVIGYSADISYPGYIQKENLHIDNFSDLVIPYGSTVDFELKCNGVDEAVFLLDSNRLDMHKQDNSFLLSYKVMQSGQFSFLLKNKNLEKSFLDRTLLKCISDLYPEIIVEQDTNPNNYDILYFKGLIRDDYGFTALEFIDESNPDDTILLQINKNDNSQNFYFEYQFSASSGIKNKIVKYYFEVTDNDAINGYKSTKSKIYEYEVPSLEKISEMKQEKAENIFKSLDESEFLARDIQNDLMELKRKLLSEKLSDWEKTNLLNKIEEKKNSLESLLKDIIKQNNERQQISKSLQSNNQELLEKQKLIEELLKGLMDDEMKKMLDELANLKNNLDKDQLNKMANELNFKMDDLKKEVDRNLELLKKMKISDDIDKISNDLNFLADEQKKLSETDNTKKLDSLKQTNKEQTEFFNKLKENYQKTLEENKQLSNPEKLEEFKEEFNQIEEQLNENSNSLEIDKREKFKKGTRESEKNIRELAQKMNSMLRQSEADREGENAETLRQILDNLMELSFAQESVINTYATIDVNNPGFVTYQVDEKNLLDNYKIIKDSLYNLSKRTAYLGNIISNSSFEIEDNITKSIESLSERNKYKALQQQRLAFKSMNDLILLLSESLKNMENASGGDGGGQKKCKKQKPSKGEPSLSDMRKSQEDLKKQMKNMLEQMKQGSQNGMSQQLKEGLAKTMMQNEIYQQMLNDMLQNSDIGKETARKLEEIKKLMEENNKDIIHNRLNNQTLLRQQNIVTRLLEAENAEKEREQDNQRKSTEAGQIKRPSPVDVFDDFNKNSNYNDLLQNNTLKLNYFYKEKYQEYLNNINSMQP